MVNWLQPITDVLDKSVKPVQVFFRDDDVGWSNAQLYAMLDEFAKAEIAIDLAVIPAALDDKLADQLLARWQQDEKILGFHQHGYSHSNHETEGRKCEFGRSRCELQQKTDLANGKQLLQDSFDHALDPFFTPPWNRCTQTTLECLDELAFRLLSRDITAEQFTSPSLMQQPVHVDWSKIIKNSPNDLDELGQSIAGQLVSNELTGIMLHHADMQEIHLQPLAQLLAVIANHHNARSVLLRNIFS